MKVLNERHVVWLLAVAVVAGCSPEVEQAQQLERQGEYQYAYDIYYHVLESSRRNGAATAGMKRSIPHAVEYWQQQAEEAAAANQWQQAAQCYFKVLQIKPNETKSIEAVRQIARQHPQDVELASAEQIFLQPPDVGELGGNGEKTIVVESGQRDGTEDVDAVKLAGEEFAGGQASSEGQSKGAYGPVVAAPPPKEKMKFQGKRFLAVGPGAATKPAQLQKEQSAPAPAFDPFRQIPAVYHDELASSSNFIFVVSLGQNKRAYPVSAALRGGLSVKFKGAHDDPETADLELRLNDKTIGRYGRLTPNSVITVAAVDGRLYEVVVLEISGKTRSATIGLRECP